MFIRTANITPSRILLLFCAAGALLGLQSGCARGDAEAAESAGEDPFRTLDLAAATTQAQTEGKLVFVDLWAPWCGPCKLLDRTTWKDPRVREWLATHTVPIKINVDQHPDIAERFGVTSIPTLLVVKPDGTEVARVIGYVDAAGFSAKFRGTVASGQ